jgi:hypothetical protein
VDGKLNKSGDTMTGVLNVIAGTVTAPAIAPSGDSNTGIFFPAADTVAIGEGGTEVLRINSAGNVGIGTTSPSEKLTIQQSSTNNIGIGIYNSTPYSAGNTAGGNIKLGKQEGSNFQAMVEISGNPLSHDDSSNGMLLIKTRNSGTLTEAMRIDPYGNVGIGTTNPTNKLTVVGSANIASDGFGPASFGVDGSIYGNIITGAYAEITDIAVPASLEVWGTATVQTPTATNHAATKGYVDTQDALKINKAGDTMTGALVLNADPTIALGAATKRYVDNVSVGSTIYEYKNIGGAL